MITLKQIAEAAQVSRGTVDRVLHGRDGVDPKTRARVLKILEEQNYRPNVLGRALRGMQNTYRIGAIVPSEANRFWIDVHNGITEAAKMAAVYGMEIVCMRVDRMTAENIIACIDRLEAMSVCGIMLVPIEDESLRQRINALPESIPVITFNSDIANTRRMCFVGNDHVMAGRTAGQLMQLVTAGRTGKIAVLISQHEWLAHEERYNGFCEYYREHACEGDMIFDAFCTHEDEQRAYQITEMLLREHPEVTGIYIAGGGQEGASLAMKHAARKGEVHMICHDLLPDTIAALREGYVDFTLGQEAFEQGYLPIEIFRDYHMLGRLPAVSRIYTRIDIRSSENVMPKGSEMFMRSRGTGAAAVTERL